MSNMSMSKAANSMMSMSNILETVEAELVGDWLRAEDLYEHRFKSEPPHKIPQLRAGKAKCMTFFDLKMTYLVAKMQNLH